MADLKCLSLVWTSFLAGAQTVSGERSLQNKPISGTILARERRRGPRSEFAGTGGKSGFRAARVCSIRGRALGRRLGRNDPNHRTNVSEPPAGTFSSCARLGGRRTFTRASRSPRMLHCSAINPCTIGDVLHAMWRKHQRKHYARGKGCP